MIVGTKRMILCTLGMGYSMKDGHLSVADGMYRSQSHLATLKETSYGKEAQTMKILMCKR